MLAGCSSGTLEDTAPAPEAIPTAQTAVPSTDSPSPTEPVPSFAADIPSFESEWAKEQLENFMIYQGANSLEGFSKGSPERNIIAVDSPEQGVVRFIMADRDYEAEDWNLEGTAVNFMSYTGCAADDVVAVIVETADGTESAYMDRC